MIQPTLETVRKEKEKYRRGMETIIVTKSDGVRQPPAQFTLSAHQQHFLVAITPVK
jgi:hypothetical protein